MLLIPWTLLQPPQVQHPSLSLAPEAAMLQHLPCQQQVHMRCKAQHHQLLHVSFSPWV